MKNTIHSLLIMALGLFACVLAVACRHQSKSVAPKAAEKDTVAVKPARDSVVRSLKELYRRPKGDTIAFCDLSHKGLRVMPDLSRYTIRRLDLSHNAFAGDFPEGRFPRGLEDLSVAYNKIVTLTFPNDLKRLDISHNDIHKYYVAKNRFSGGLYLETPDSTFALKYLNVSYNWRMHSFMSFDPQDVDALIHVHAAHNENLRKYPEDDMRLGVTKDCFFTKEAWDSMYNVRTRDTTAEDKTMKQ